MSNDFQAQILKRLALLERRSNHGIRLGRVAKDGVKKNMVRIELGGQSDGKPLLSPWIRTGGHHGFANENMPYEEGQTVALFSMDNDLRQAIVMPYSNSEQDPLPEDAGNKRHTYRLRKPRKKKEEQKSEEGSGEQGSESGGGFFSGGEIKDYKPEDFEAQKDDDDNDFLYNRNYAGTVAKKGKAYQGVEKYNETEDGEDEQQQQSGSSSAAGTSGQDDEKGKDRDYLPGKIGDPDESQQSGSGGGGSTLMAAAAGGGGSSGSGQKQKKDHAFLITDKARVDVWGNRVTVRHGDKSRSDYTDGKQVHKVGGATITVTESKIELKVGGSILAVTDGKVFTVGDTSLGSEDASRELSLKGTVDSAGHLETSNLSTKVKGI